MLIGRCRMKKTRFVDKINVASTTEVDLGVFPSSSLCCQQVIFWLWQFINQVKTVPTYSRSLSSSAVTSYRDCACDVTTHQTESVMWYTVTWISATSIFWGKYREYKSYWLGKLLFQTILFIITVTQIDGFTKPTCRPKLTLFLSDL